MALLEKLQGIMKLREAWRKIERNEEAINKEIVDHKASTQAHDATAIKYNGKVVGTGNAKQAIDNVQEQVNTLVLNGDSSVAAAQAAVDANGYNYGNLKRRLDEEHTQITEQLADKAQKSEVTSLQQSKADRTELQATNAVVAQKADKEYVDTITQNLASGSPKGTYATLADLEAAYPTGATGIYVVRADNSWYYWSGSAWTSGGQFLSEGLTFRSVNMENTTFLERGINLYNKDDINVGQVVNTSNGQLVVSGSGNSSSKPIFVEPNTDYFKRIGGAPNQIAFYDADMNFISATTGQGFRTPANCRYVIINVGASSIETQQLERGTSFTGFEPFGLKIKYAAPAEKVADNAVKNKSIIDEAVSYEKTDFVVRTRNLFNPHDTVTGYVINAATGAITASSSGNSLSGFILVQEGVNYIKNFDTPKQVTFHDANFTFMSGVETIGFTTPAGCRYVRFNFPESSKNTVQLEQGTTSTTFEPFGYRFKYQSAVVADGGLGIRYSLTGNTSAAERVDGYTQNSLDDMYPFNSIKLCNVAKTTWGATRITYEGESGFARDGSNGQVMVEIPKVYFRRYRKDGYEYIHLSGQQLDGYQIDPAFVEDGKELNAIYVGVYDGYITDSKLNSWSGVFPTRDTSLTDLRTLAKNNGAGFGLLDYRTVALLQRLFMVYFASRDSQGAVGAGYTQLHYQTFSTCVARSNLPNSNYILVNTLGHPNRKFLVGDTVTVSDEYAVTQNRLITHIEQVDTRLGITFDGDPVNVIEGVTRIYHTPQRNGKTDTMTHHSGSANVFGVQGHDAVRLFFIENLWGNIWTYLDGVVLDNLVCYVGENMSDYTSTTTYRTTYKPLAMKFPVQDSNEQDESTEFEFFIKNLAFDKVNPAYQVPLEIGTTGATSNFSDPWFAHDMESQIPAFGGGWDLWFRAGIFSTRFWYSMDQPHNLNAGRLIYKPIN